jgi:tetratricopeptide (TPR) repeat protein
VVGRTFWSGALAQERERVGAALHALERKEFIRREGGSAVEGEQQYSFRHVLLRDVAYGQIPRAGRASKHLEVARWVESLGGHQDYADLLAHHYVSAVDYASAAGQDCSPLVGPARTALVEAATRAFGLNAFKNAARYYERALGLSREDDPNHPDLLFAFAEALHRSGAEQRQQRLQEAREQLLASGDVERAAQAEGMLAEVAWDEGDRERCSDHLGRALAFLQTRASSPARARVLANLARLRLSTGEHEAALEPAREALNMADTLELVEVRADALITLGSARIWLMDAAGTADIERGLNLALASNSLTAATRGYGGLWLATALEAPGDVERLRELDEESSRLAEQLGNAHILRTAHANTIALQRFSGEWDKALEAADAFIAECEGGSSHRDEKNVLVQRAYIRQARDDTTGALADIEKSIALWHNDKGRLLYIPAALTVFLLVELGRHEEAEALAREIVDRPQPWIASSEFTLVANQVGYQGILRTALKALPRQRPADVAALAITDGRLVEAADLLVEMGFNAPAARVRLRAIEVLSKQGSDLRAREQFDKAVAFYRSVGATRYIRQAERLLEASQFQQREQPAPQRRA